MNKHIESLIQYEIKQGIIHERDYIYVRNQLYDLLDVEVTDETVSYEVIQTPSEALEPILDELVKKGLLINSTVERDLFDTKIMNVFAVLPSTLEDRFYTLAAISKTDATDYLYNYAKSLNYIRYNRILKNKSFNYKTDDISLQITINLSKPEKDPKDIISASKRVDINYPNCVLCKENEGFAGNLKREARNQHRLIKLNLSGKPWYFQYSPYIYYNEHAIVLSNDHVPMKITKQTFSNLLGLVDQFEGYFFGSNADLPIVGGSILSHDHYQGGKHKFPIEDATSIKSWLINDVHLNALNWPLSTIRLMSSNKEKLINLANAIFKIWQNYSNPSLNIINFTNDIPHNTITPVARYKNEMYELDLILRNNRTTHTFPLGIFHPHSDKHHIKKENIGLIETMGLAILPARLIKEIDDLKEYHFNGQVLSEGTLIHKTWFDGIAKESKLTHSNFDEIIEFEIGKVFEQVLIDCGIFKQKDKPSFIRFIEKEIYEKLSK